jgi:hypothetical protein
VQRINGSVKFGRWLQETLVVDCGKETEKEKRATFPLLSCPHSVFLGALGGSVKHTSDLFQLSG